MSEAQRFPLGVTTHSMREIQMLKGKKLGEILLRIGVIDSNGLDAALAHARAWVIPLGQACVDLGIASEDSILRALAVQMAAPVVSLTGAQIAAEVIEMVPARTAVARRAIPLSFTPGDKGARGTLTVAIDLPRNVPALDEIGFATGHRVAAVIASSADVDAALVSLYQVDPTDGSPLVSRVDLEGGPGLDHVVSGYFDFGKGGRH